MKIVREQLVFVNIRKKPQNQREVRNPIRESKIFPGLFFEFWKEGDTDSLVTTRKVSGLKSGLESPKHCHRASDQDTVDSCSQISDDPTPGNFFLAEP